MRRRWWGRLGPVVFAIVVAVGCGPWTVRMGGPGLVVEAGTGGCSVWWPEAQYWEPEFFRPQVGFRFSSYAPGSARPWVFDLKAMPMWLRLRVNLWLVTLLSALFVFRSRRVPQDRPRRSGPWGGRWERAARWCGTVLLVMVVGVAVLSQRYMIDARARTGSVQAGGDRLALVGGLASDPNEFGVRLYERTSPGASIVTQWPSRPASWTNNAVERGRLLPAYRYAGPHWALTSSLWTLSVLLAGIASLQWWAVAGRMRWPRWVLRGLTRAAIVIAGLWCFSEFVEVGWYLGLEFELSRGSLMIWRPLYAVRPDVVVAGRAAWVAAPGISLPVFTARLPLVFPPLWGIQIPLWLPLVVTIVAAVDLRWLRRGHRAGHCPRCSYNLTGNESGICPECGERVEVSV